MSLRQFHMSANSYSMAEHDVPGDTLDSQGNILVRHDISHDAVLIEELARICDPTRDPRSMLTSLARRCEARAIRVFHHEDGEVRELASTPAHALTTITINPGLRERLLRAHTVSRVRTLGGKARRVWQPLLPDDLGPMIALELVVAPRLIAIAILVPDPRWLEREVAGQASWIHARLEPWLAPLTLRMRLFDQERELVRLREQLDSGARQRLDNLTFDPDRQEIVGASGGLRQVMERVELVSGSDVPVMLFGETGSGKEVIARAIHEASARHREPFVRVNCGAIPPELIDSQLFGHERGSFTGATEQRKGWFERANGGTLFLDEVGELPLAAQVRLLRVLQDHAFERVGGQTAVQVDCRILAATHRDLPTMVQAGQFREDLWYRLAVFPLVIPPLRERPVDIPPLARWFARRAVRFGLPPCMPNEDDLARLLAYDWPGNVRELAAVIDRAAILGRGRKLDIETSLGAVRLDDGSSHGQRDASPIQPRAASLATLDEATKGHIETVLTMCEGRIEGPRGAARVLDINPHTLRSRMRKLGLDWQRFRPAGEI
jgi:hydrogenase-4 transcriptional activator